MKRKSENPENPTKSKKAKVYIEDRIPDYYAALDLPPGVGTLSIRRAYRQLSLVYQRDTDDYEELTRANKIWEAATTLLNPSRRFAYDELFRSNPEMFETNENIPNNYRMSDINWTTGHHPPYVPGSHEVIRQELLGIFHIQGQREARDVISCPSRRQMFEYFQSKLVNRIKEMELATKRVNIPIKYLAPTTPKTRTGDGTLMPSPPSELRAHGGYLELLNHLKYVETSLVEIEEMMWKSSKNWGYIMTQLRSCLNVWKEEDLAADRELRQLKWVYAEKKPDPFTRNFDTDSDWDNSFLERRLYERMIQEKIRRYLAFRKTFQEPNLSLDGDMSTENESNGKEKNQWLLTFLQTFPLRDWELEFGPPAPPPGTPVLESASEIVDMDVIRSYAA